MPVNPIPDGYHTATPYLIIRGAAKAIEFYAQAFGAVEVLRLQGPDGRVGHAEVKIGDSMIMLADEHPEWNAKSPETYGGSPVSLLLYFDDVDARFRQAIAAGATEVRPLADQFYGDRSGVLKDPFGHTWSIASHIEDVSQEEIERRFAAMVNPSAS
jgi:PhnB protein